jgi:DNA-directed RNA polymerase subunit RPC12/RpoP
MSDSPVTSLVCTQCGGELHPDEGQLFLTCPYCGTTVYLDPGQVVFHWYLAPTLDDGMADGALNRWMSGSQTIKDLDKKSKVVEQTFQYYPLWYFLIRQGDHEITDLEPGAAISITEITHLDLPAGDLRPYNPKNDSQSITPSVPIETSRDWLLRKNPGAEIKQSALVHIPVYIFRYQYRNQVYTALVEAGTGKVFANIFPAKAEAPYLIAGGITALVYLCLAVLALSGLQAGGFIFNFGLALILAAIFAPFLFFMAVMVASRV